MDESTAATKIKLYKMDIKKKTYCCSAGSDLPHSFPK